MKPCSFFIEVLSNGIRIKQWLTFSLLFLQSSDGYMDNDWLDSLFEDPVLNDKMITDAVQPPRIHSEHSYSINDNSVPSSPLGIGKLEGMGWGPEVLLWQHKICVVMVAQNSIKTVYLQRKFYLYETKVSKQTDKQIYIADGGLRPW